MTLAAADGSTLTLSYEGTQSAPAGGVASFFHTDTVIVGTGRFEGAAGTWSINGNVDFTTLTITGTVSGWLSY